MARIFRAVFVSGVVAGTAATRPRVLARGDHPTDVVPGSTRDPVAWQLPI